MSKSTQRICPRMNRLNARRPAIRARHGSSCPGLKDVLSTAYVAIRWRAIRHHRGLANHRVRRPPTKAPPQAAPIQSHTQKSGITYGCFRVRSAASISACARWRLHPARLRVWPYRVTKVHTVFLIVHTIAPLELHTIIGRVTSAITWASSNSNKAENRR
jgi:hypothetical protein